VHHHCQLV